MDDRIWEIQFRRARRLSSLRTIYQGACLLSVALRLGVTRFGIVRTISYTTLGPLRLVSTGTIVDARLKAPMLLLLSDLQPHLDQHYLGINNVFFYFGAEIQEPLMLRVICKIHDTNCVM